MRPRNSQALACGAENVANNASSQDGMRERTSVPASVEELLRIQVLSRLSADGSAPRSVLFLSRLCRRALYAERYCETWLATRKSMLEFERLQHVLFLSAGLENRPGDDLPYELLRTAAVRGVNVSEDAPCAAFDPWLDFEQHDLIISMDNAAREAVLKLARQVPDLDLHRVGSKVKCMSDLAPALRGEQLLELHSEQGFELLEQACASFLSEFMMK